MYKKILVPLDGSKRAERILFYVEELARRFKSELVLLQVIEPSHLIVDPHGSFPDFDLELIKERFLEAERYLKGIQGEFSGKGFSVLVFAEKGNVVSTIIRVSNREDVDLIAMASHGHSGLSRVFYGSVAAGVLHQIDRPLLLIRTRRD